ncbi:hypothetical protein GCM10010218_22080 [Streptomyces mashuensis]|uniref:Secreted protein n=1 Tax=Streptomyces mashuensis TaxID=33904 RepID=A0A919B2H3_9ACTN|nr:hypothetical protein [Streptomyces mashuensis]GHF40302.1 hypothetical protein GCM10010218_22080 [Streptomyces mashuensis]
MQSAAAGSFPSSGPTQPLPHTRPRPLHWLATAAALAAVLTGAALTGPGTTPEAHPAAVAAPDARAAHYPLDCGRAPAEVVHQATADLDRDGRPETVAQVRCPAGGGTPPSGLYLLGTPAAGSAAPRLLATLVDPAERMTVTGLGAGPGTVSATLLGYSGPAVPRCCPDRRRAVKWHWRDGRFVLTALAPQTATAGA